MTGFIVSVFPFRNRVSLMEAFEWLELGEGKLSRPVLRGPGGRKAAWLLGSYSLVQNGIAPEKRIIKGRPFEVGVDRSHQSYRTTLMNDAKYIGQDVHQPTIPVAPRTRASTRRMRWLGLMRLWRRTPN